MSGGGRLSVSWSRRRPARHCFGNKKLRMYWRWMRGVVAPERARRCCNVLKTDYATGCDTSRRCADVEHSMRLFQ
jgi:hypothetical protein